tara:strand:- start:148 stop:759 length:612 start_codon:yes stop_codon:yes gene_type:complete
MLKKIKNSTKINSSTETPQVPPGQYETDKFPVMTFGDTPSIDLHLWEFNIFGLIDTPIVLNWNQFTSLQSTKITADFHCVTQWSRINNEWEGILFNDLMPLIQPKPKARFVMVHCYGGYTTNLELDVLTDQDVLFAHSLNGTQINKDHGGPLRLVVPKRYAWKSAKWVNGLEFMEANASGFWESQGYHMDGNPLLEQRFDSND